MSTGDVKVPGGPGPERTAVASQTGVSSQGPGEAFAEGGNGLPIGTLLGEFEIGSVIGEGGFGIVYLAQDHSLGRRVALKEYMPSSLAQRTGRTQVSVKSERHRETFEAGLKSFVNEARLLAQFDHPSLVKVYRFWEANGTAYMVMPFYEGVTLKDRLKALGAPPDEAWLRELLEPLTEALMVIHAEQCFHRDIAPDNVILLKGSERPLLLDFGAARRVIGDMTQALTVILKPGYAPIEQYAEVPGMKQGPWTDVYALAAVVHYAITGRTPPTSVARLMNDSCTPLAQSGAGRYSATFLGAIDRALIVQPEQRLQSIGDLRRALRMPDLTTDGASSERRTRPKPDAVEGLPPAPEAPGRSRTGIVAGIGVAMVIALGGAYISLSGPRATTSAASSPAAAPVTVIGAKTEMPATLAPAAAAPVVASAASPVTQPSVPTPPVFDPVRDFERVAAAQSARFGVVAAPDKPSLRINKDAMTFKVKADRDGFLYVFQYGTDGGIVQILPSSEGPPMQVRAGVSISLPPREVVLTAGGPPGTDHLIAIVSEHPRDFSALGMKPSGGFRQTTIDVASIGARTLGAGTPVFEGKAICRQPCNDDFGAAIFTVEEIR